VLASSLDHEQTLQGVASLAVPGFADWCSVSIPRPDGLIEQVALAHADPDKVARGHRMRERYPSHVDDPEGAARIIREGKAEILDLPDELLVEVAQDEEHLELLRGLGLRSAMLVPMVAGEQTVGVLAFVQAESGRRFTQRDLALGQELGRRAGTAIENARLFRERSAIARDLQAGLRPPRLPEIPGWRLEGHYEAAGEENEVGGDFYDAFEIPGGWMLVVGDVAGRGATAAALTSLARYTIRTAGKLVGDPLVALAHLNRSLHDRGEHGALCSAALLVLREEGAKALATVVCAGHPLPFLIRDGDPAPVGEFGTFLGAFPRERWTPVELVLEPGDQLLLYTDGVLDARGEDDRFGESRLAEAITGAKAPQETIGRVERALRDFEADARRDDVALLAVMRVSAREARPEPDEDHAASLAGVGQRGRALDGLDEEAVRRAASA
jgi:serine phosphatase RsbU (regulator of sigma subunit)